MTLASEHAEMLGLKHGDRVLVVFGAGPPYHVRRMRVDTEPGMSSDDYAHGLIRVRELAAEREGISWMRGWSRAGVKALLAAVAL